MDTLVRLHVGLLDKAFATEPTFVLLHFHVDLLVPFQRANRGELFVAKLARQTFELGVSLDVSR